MDWIHCNKCLKQFDSGIVLHLTSCGHMLCTGCLKNGTKDNTCVSCAAPCAVMKLDKEINEDVQDYFRDPEEILIKACEVLRFQKGHRRRLMTYLMQMPKKVNALRNELKRIHEICQKQQNQMKEDRQVIKELRTQLANRSQQISPSIIRMSPGNNISPSFIQGTPVYKRPSKSTPYTQPYQSTLVTPARLSKQRITSFSAHSQKSNTSNRISSTVFTPPTPESAGSLSQCSNESGYASPEYLTPNMVYCNGFDVKCPFKKRRTNMIVG